MIVSYGIFTISSLFMFFDVEESISDIPTEPPCFR